MDNGNWVWRGNVSMYGWADWDGNKAETFRDVDGSITGWPNTQVVRTHPFYTGPHCRPRPNWDMTVCPFKYMQVCLYTYKNEDSL